jgi:hypothetical protein
VQGLHVTRAARQQRPWFMLVADGGLLDRQTAEVAG